MSDRTQEIAKIDKKMKVLLLKVQD